MVPVKKVLVLCVDPRLTPVLVAPVYQEDADIENGEMTDRALGAVGRELSLFWKSGDKLEPREV